MRIPMPALALVLALSACMDNPSGGAAGPGDPSGPVTPDPTPADTSHPGPFDGLQWTKAESGTRARLNAIIWTGARLYVVGDSGTLLTSVNGVTWERIKTGIGNILVDVAWTGKRLIAINSIGKILTSETGAAWTARGTNVKAAMKVVGWTGSKAVAMGDNGDFAYSADGLEWTPGHFDYSSFHPTALVKGGDLTYCVGYRTVHLSGSYNYEALAFETSDGTTWSSSSPGYDCNSMMAATWTGSKLLAVGTYGEVFAGGSWGWTSVLWHPDHYSESAWYKELDDLYGIAWTGTKAVAVGENGMVLTSDQGALRHYERHWRPAEDVTFMGVVWTGKRAVAIGSSGIIYYSP